MTVTSQSFVKLVKYTFQKKEKLNSSHKHISVDSVVIFAVSSSEKFEKRAWIEMGY